MAGSMSFAKLRELAKRKNEGCSSSQQAQTPPPPPPNLAEKETAPEIAIPGFRALEETEGSPVQDLVHRKKGKQQKELTTPSPSGTDKRGIVDLDQVENSPPPKRSKLGKESHRKSRSPKPFSLEGFMQKNYEEYCSDPFGALAQVLKHGSDLHLAWKQDAENKVKAANDEKDETLRLIGESKKTLEKTLAALEKAKKEKEDLELERDQALQDKRVLTTRAEEAEKKATKAETDLAEALTSVTNLRIQVADLESRLIERTRAKDAEISDIADQACTLAEQAFANALAQVVVLYPDVSLDENILKVDHEVREGKIGKPSADGKEFDVVGPLP